MTAPLHSSSNRSTIELLEARIAPATFTVLNLNDAGAGSLRDAVADANAAASDDKIVFQTGLAGKITLTSGEIPITDDLVIRGPAAGAIKISGNDASRIFNINDGVATESSVKLINLTLRDGSVTFGGAVLSQENLTVKNSVFRNNAATFSGGAVFVAEDTTLKVANTLFVKNTAVFGGGAVNVSGNLDVRSSSFTGNTSVFEGGAVLVTGVAVNTKAVIVGTLFQINKAGAGGGGAIHLDGVESAAIRDCAIIGNATTGAGQDGGGIHLVNAFLNLTRTTIGGNIATDEGGGLSIDAGSTAFLDACVVKGNEATGQDGGGIISAGSLVVTGSRIVKNRSGDDGGGIRTEGGNVAIIRSLIRGNISSDDGGGVDLLGSSDTLIDHCSITGNTAAGTGGGLRVANGTLTVIATTIASNSADIAGGVSLSGSVIARFTDSFITGNAASTSGGGIVETAVTAPVLQNTRVTGNTAPVNPQTSGVFLIG